MPNIFAAILATATDAAQIIAQEPVGFINAIEFRPDIIGATKDTVVNVGIVTPAVKSVWVAGVKTTAKDSTEVNVPLTLDQAFEYEFHITGEQLRGFSVGSYTGQKYVKDKIAMSMRQCRNDIEAFLALRAKTGAHRACGTAGTTPFASNMDLTATVRRLLEENGAPINAQDVSLIMNPAAAEKVRTLLGTVTAAGGSTAQQQQRSGALPEHNGMQLRVSPQIVTHVKSTGTAYTATGANLGTDVTLAAGAGTYLAGDVATFAGDTNPYVLGVGGSTNVLVPKLINRPGLIGAKAAAAMTIGNNYVPNMAIHRSSMVCVVRPPEQINPAMLGVGINMPFLADVVEDPATGLIFGVYMQLADGMVLVSIRALYGAANVNTEFMITAMG